MIEKAQDVEKQLSTIQDVENGRREEGGGGVQLKINGNDISITAPECDAWVYTKAFQYARIGITDPGIFRSYNRGHSSGRTFGGNSYWKYTKNGEVSYHNGYGGESTASGIVRTTSEWESSDRKEIIFWQIGTTANDHEEAECVNVGFPETFPSGWKPEEVEQLSGSGSIVINHTPKHETEFFLYPPETVLGKSKEDLFHFCFLSQWDGGAQTYHCWVKQREFISEDGVAYRFCGVVAETEEGVCKYDLQGPEGVDKWDGRGSLPGKNFYKIQFWWEGTRKYHFKCVAKNEEGEEEPFEGGIVYKRREKEGGDSDVLLEITDTYRDFEGNFFQNYYSSTVYAEPKDEYKSEYVVEGIWYQEDGVYKELNPESLPKWYYSYSQESDYARLDVRGSYDAPKEFIVKFRKKTFLLMYDEGIEMLIYKGRD